VVLLEHTCTIRRPAAVGTNGRKAMTDLYTSVSCLLLPMSDQTSIRHNFTLGRAYDVYFEDGQDVKVGDQIVVDGNKYAIRSVQPYRVPVVGHVRAAAEQEVS
jgi:hypothetical protein